MNKSKFKLLDKTKLEFFYLRKAFFEYGQGWRYLFNRFFLARKIFLPIHDSPLIMGRLRVGKKILEKPVNNFDLSIHLLTCHQDLVMLIWSLASFITSWGDEMGEVYIHSDGSLIEDDQRIIKKFFPEARLILPDTLEKCRPRALNQYPHIRNFRFKNPGFFLMQKLIDPYLVSEKKIHLVIDSDLLWFKEPLELKEEIGNNCENSLMMRNNALTSITFKDGRKISADQASFNSGIVLYRRDNFNLVSLEKYLKEVDDSNPLNHQFIEQAGYARCLKNLVHLPEEKYSIKNEVAGQTIVRHYTSPRRPLFYIEGIQLLKDKLF